MFYYLILITIKPSYNFKCDILQILYIWIYKKGQGKGFYILCWTNSQKSTLNRLNTFIVKRIDT